MISILLQYVPQDSTFFVRVKRFVGALGLVSGEDGVEAMLEGLEDLYEVPGMDPDDTGALMLAIDFSNAVREVSVEVTGNSHQNQRDSIEVRSNFASTAFSYYH